MFVGITPELCAEAWRLIEPSLEAACANGAFNKPHVGFALLNPAAPDGPPLFTAVVGDGLEFVTYAEAKARVALRTGYDTTTMRDLMPHLYQPGDIKWPGGVLRDGLAMGCSGIQGEYDQMVCEWFASTVKALARLGFYGPGGEGDQPTPYLGREA